MVVQKFGGTSVADPEAIRRLIEIVRTARARDGRGPVVVVSAMSKVTDALLGIASSAGAGRPGDALPLTDALCERHKSTVRALVSGPAQAPLLAHIAGQFDQLADIVRALAVLREVSPRTLDVVAAMGELLSSRIVAAALTEAGVPADWVDARCAIVTDAEHTRAAPLGPETSAALRKTVVPILDSGRVAVLGGFVGATLDGHTSTLGRGGSDYSGALVGAGIDAREIQIWTDVDGMLSADPRVIASHLAAVVCRGGRARILWREGAASEHDSSGRRAEHSRPHSQLVEAGRRRHLDYRADGRRRPASDRAGQQA
jgi:aspartate kinase